MFPVINQAEALATYSASQLQAIGNSLDRIARKGYHAETPAYDNRTTFKAARAFWTYARAKKADDFEVRSGAKGRV